MKKQFFQSFLLPYLAPCLVVMAVMSLIILSYNLILGLICLVVCVAMMFYQGSITQKTVLPRVIEYEAQLLQDNDQIMYTLKNSDSLPLCTIDASGKLAWQNARFEALRAGSSPIEEVLTKERLGEIFSGEKSVDLTLSWGGRSYRVNSTQVGGTSPRRLLIWDDVTDAEEARKLYTDSRTCVCYISVDNYDEILSDTPTEDQSSVEAAIDKCIRSWAGEMNAAVSRFRQGSYMIFFEQRFMDTLREGRFSILNDMHEIVTGADFPTSLSIGVGCDGTSLDALQSDARQAMELALGRGGDQAVIRRQNGDNEYFGGALPTVEKRNKGKSRMVAHALLQQMATADRVVIMGHSRPDMDAIGSAIGLYQLAQIAEKDVCIALNGVGEAIQQIYDAAEATGRYVFETSDVIKEKMTEDTLLIVTDCHSSYTVEAPELVEAAQRIVIIDHHRRSKGAIENATLVHTEVYASSASELVTELLQYAGSKSIDRFTANALLAGITVDTKNFTVNTGVRTFEAAAWLRRNGADGAEVKKYFKLKLDFVQKKYNLIASAEILDGGVAVAYTKESDDSMQVLTAQAADELLEMQGVRAAFAAGRGARGTNVSARASGQINVQTIMEKMGGGGHMNVAAAQVQASPEEAIQQVVQILREEAIIG